MPDLNAFVADVRARIEALRSEELPAPSLGLPQIAFVPGAIDLNDLSGQLEALLGGRNVASFYTDWEPRTETGTFHLHGALYSAVQACCTELPGGSFSLDCDTFGQRLAQLAKAVAEGIVDYTLSLRVINIDITDAFALGGGLLFRRLDAQTVQAKYPFDERFALVYGRPAEYLRAHQVEALLSGRATPSEVQRLCTVEAQDAIVNSIRHAFILADVSPTPDVTHIRIDSPIVQRLHLKGMGRDLSFDPPPLTTEALSKVQQMYALAKSVETDSILRTALDRFILGRKQDLHHPNRINTPHWDKLVDYVIALETLLLSVQGSPSDEQLSYRFRLNGSSLLAAATGSQVRATFHALKHLYDLRSTVVHGGGDEKKVMKLANKFVQHAGIDDEHHRHPLGRLMVVARHVEGWIMTLLSYLTQIPAPERPFRKVDGWEELLWASRSVSGE